MTLSSKAAGEVYTAAEYNELLTLLNVLKQRPLTLWADGGIQSTANSVTWGQQELGNGFPITYGIFQAATYRNVERLQWFSPMESNWDSGTLTARVVWTVNSTHTDTVAFTLMAVRVPDGATIGAAIPTVATLTDTEAGTAYYMHETPVSTGFSITGSGNNILWELRRSTTDTSTSSVLGMAVKTVYTVG